MSEYLVAVGYISAYLLGTIALVATVCLAVGLAIDVHWAFSFLLLLLPFEIAAFCMLME